MTGHALLAPLTDLAATRVGRSLWRKQVLKKGTIGYKGRTLVFDDAYLHDLSASFNAGAFDQVAFQLADTTNTHTEDPERFRGEVLGVEVTPTGLDAILSLSEAGSKIVEDNPSLGVSCRIEEQLEKADGRRFPRAIKHVLGTLNPRVTGMSPWSPVTLAGDHTPAVDLTAATYTEGAGMPEFTDEEMAKLRALLASDPAPAKPAATTDPATTPAVAEPSDADLEAEIERILAETDPAPAAAGAGLSVEARDAIDLANRTAEIASQRIAELEASNARTEWKAESASLLAAGVPKAVVDLAQTVIAPTTIDLAAGDTIPGAADTVRKILAEYPRIDLTGELGARVPATSPDGEKAAENAAKQFLTLYDPAYAAAPGGNSR